MLEQLRRKRRDTLEQHDLGGIYDDIAQELRDIVDQERGALDDLAREARESGDQRRQEITEEVTQERQMQLDMLPPDLAGQVQQLQEYEFTSSGGPRALRAAPGPAPPAAHAELLQPDGRGDAERQPRADAAHEGHALGAQPDAGAAGAGRGHRASRSRSSWSATATSSPRTRSRSTSCSRSWPQRMAAMQSLLNSMTPEQRAQLQGLAEQLLEDMDLRWQMDQLGRPPARAVPADGLGPLATTSAARTRSASPRRST